MRTAPVIAGRWTLMACALVAVGGLGCTNSETPSTDSAPGDSQPPVVLQRTPNMPEPFETISKADFDNYVGTTLTFDPASGEQDVERHCKPPNLAQCQGTGRRPKVDIDPAQNTGGIDPDNLHDNGHIVARVHNNSPLRRENRYDLPPDTVVYWLVTRGKSRFVWFDARGNRRSVGEAPFVGCRKKDTHIDSKRAGFKRCPITLTTPAESVAALNSRISDPAWISCVPGCCVAAEAF